MGAGDTNASGTPVPSSSSFGSNLTKQKGGGNKMTIPAMFKINTTPGKKKFTHFSGDGAILTPTKRKLIINCNTRTLLRVFENDAGKPLLVKLKVRLRNGGVKKQRGQQT